MVTRASPACPGASSFTFTVPLETSRCPEPPFAPAHVLPMRRLPFVTFSTASADASTTWPVPWPLPVESFGIYRPSAMFMTAWFSSDT